MKPLQPIALGLVLLVLHARFDQYDALADPVGWLLILLGVRALVQRTAIEGRLGLTYLGALALIVSTAMWFPAAQDAVADADPGLQWAVDVPALGFHALLCHGLAGLAAAAGERTAAAWFRLTALGLVVALVVPLLYHGAGWEWAGGGAVLVLAAPLLLTVLAFCYSSSAWTGADQRLPRSVRRATGSDSSA